MIIGFILGLLVAVVAITIMTYGDFAELEKWKDYDDDLYDDGDL